MVHTHQLEGLAEYRRGSNPRFRTNNDRHVPARQPPDSSGPLAGLFCLSVATSKVGLADAEAWICVAGS